jgi:hypothetical protein
LVSLSVHQPRSHAGQHFEERTLSLSLLEHPRNSIVSLDTLPRFPVAADKRPTCPHGFKDAVVDSAAFEALRQRYGGDLVGVATGAISGFDVLDIDNKPDGRKWWAEHSAVIPATRTHRTKSGGLHLFFQHAAGVRNTASKLAIGVDTRGDGGFVVWWPTAGLPVLRDGPIEDWPRWLLQELLRQRGPGSIRNAGADPAPLTDARLAGLYRTVANAAEGCRNHILFWASCRLVEAAREGAIAECTGIALLQRAATEAGLPRPEIDRTITSAFRGRP